MKFEVGKKYRYLIGDIFDCIFVTPKGHPVMKSVEDKSEGLFTYGFENWKEYVEPRSGTVVVNVYVKNEEIWYGACHLTREQADKTAEGLNRSKRIACVEVPWVEGQGL